MRRAQATRAELEALLAQLRPEQLSYPEAIQLQERLREGDFRVGDRIVLSVQGEPTLTDSFTVTATRTIELPGVPEISVRGILRSELDDHLTQQLSRYLKAPDVKAVSLVRLAVLGTVGQPGFYALPAQTLLSDAIMSAGGPTSQTDLAKTSIRREGKEIWSKELLTKAIANGTTLDQLNLHGGDQILVGEKKQPTVNTLRTVSLLLALPLTVYALVKLIKP
ncbi:MAG: polysaccharide biosynthesis/export family protein [Gemmatimonadales bacterium]